MKESVASESVSDCKMLMVWVTFESKVPSGRSVENTAFSLLLKADDDCYIDVDSVLLKIDHKALKRRHFWWGK